MELRRRIALCRVSLVPLIDILFILLVYFMVTSDYLDLDMIPVSEVRSGRSVEGTGTIMVRLNASGDPVFRGAILEEVGLKRLVENSPSSQFLILPSGAAPLQALATLLDSLTTAGARNVQLIRFVGE